MQYCAPVQIMFLANLQILPSPESDQSQVRKRAT